MSNQSRNRTGLHALGGLTLAAAVAFAPFTRAQAANYNDGQKVEIREGDTWSPGTIVKHEGRKFLVHYDGADAPNDEWVTSERLRAPGVGGGKPAAPTTGPGGAKPATAPTPAQLAAAKRAERLKFQVGDKIEFKWGGLWRKGTVTNRRDTGWYLITYDETASWREWVEWYRLRKRGSTEDTIGHTQPNGMIKPGQEPPRADPGEPPAGNGGGGGLAQRKADEKQKQEEADKAAPAIAVNRAGVKEVIFGGGGDAPFAPDPQLKPTQPVSSQPIAMSGFTGEGNERAESFCFAAPGPLIAAVAYGNGGFERAVTKIERFDLSAGNSLGTCTIPTGVKLLDLSPDGKQALTRSMAFGFGVNDRLDVWSVDATDPKHVVSFRPYDDQQHAARDITWARFVGQDHVITLNDQGTLVLWDLKGKAVWLSHGEARITPVLSGGGKYVGVAVSGGVAVVDAMTGKTLRVIPTQSLAGCVLSFSPDGKRLAAAAQDLLQVWEVENGGLAYDLSPVGAAGTAIDWVAPGYLLLDRRYLVSLDKGLIVWRYDRATIYDATSAGEFAGRFWYAAPGVGKGKPALASAVLPSDQVKAGAAGIDPQAALVLKPGSRVSLEVNLPGDLQQKVRDALAARLTANGVTVADGEAMKLVATTESGKSVEIAYRNMFGPHMGPFAQPAEKMSVNELISRIQLVGADGTVLWQRQSVKGPPAFLNMKKDQSVSDAVNEAMQPTAGFFTGTRIPKFLPKANNPPGLGASHLTASGATAVQ